MSLHLKASNSPVLTPTVPSALLPDPQLLRASTLPRLAHNTCAVASLPQPDSKHTSPTSANSVTTAPTTEKPTTTSRWTTAPSGINQIQKIHLKTSPSINHFLWSSIWEKPTKADFSPKKSQKTESVASYHKSHDSIPRQSSCPPTSPTFPASATTSPCIMIV